MKTLLILLVSTLLVFQLQAQNLFSASEIKPDKAFDNILVKKLSSSDDASSYVIWVKKTVKAHKHVHHTEHVYVLEGEGNFYLDGKEMKVKSGDWIYIPKNTVHAVKVTSEIPMKVISIQAPKFEGKDREFIEILNW